MQTMIYGSHWDAPVEGYEYDFDPSYGCTLQDLLEIPLPVAPTDFASFWREQYQRMLLHRPQVRIAEKQVTENGWVREVLYYTSTDGCEIGGWLVYPQDGEVQALLLEGHGYGGRADPGVPWSGTAAFYPVVRGQPALSLKPSIPKLAREHVIHGIHSREEYVILGCVHDLWVAGTVLQQRFPAAKTKMAYHGGSFGGGLGALMLAWDKRFCAGILRDVTFGNQPLRVVQRCEGSGAGVYELYRRDPSILNTLAYFDSASAAAWIEQPLFHICSLYDPKVSPPGQFSVWRAHQGEKVLFVKRTGHCAESAQETDEGLQQAIPFVLERLVGNG